MNSSISSSETAADSRLSAGHGRAALLAIVLVLLLLELGLRYAEKHHSVDMAQLEDLRHLAGQMGQRQGPGILLLGNSLTRAAVDLRQLNENRQEPEDPRAFLAHRNDTTIADWPAMYHWLSRQMARKPEWVVLGFARDQLWHDRPANPTRLAVDFGSWLDLGLFLGHELQDLDAAVEFLAADQLRVLAHRYRASRLLSQVLLPGYASQAARLNGGPEPGPAPVLATATTPDWTRLLALARRVRADGARLVVIAMPVRDSYGIPPGLRQLVATEDVLFLDARELPLNETHFRDSHHMNASGRAIYSEWLSETLAAVLHRANSGMALPATPVP